MLDPIGSFGRIRDFFISYLETAFRISDPHVARLRRDLLLQTNVLATEPYVEPVLRYEQADRPIERIAIENPDGILDPLSPDGRQAFAELVLSGLFASKESQAGPLRRESVYEPYVHQVEMLRRGIRQGQPGIVTSGTGSGKTEGFMLPTLASIVDEATRWAAPDDGYLQDQWWSDDRADWRPRRIRENRPAAIRALILYPMNALVEDQMVRLRKALDSEEARRTLNERCRGNRIFFGQYTSATPVTGHTRHPRLATNPDERRRRRRRLADLRASMRKYSRDQDAARRHDAERQCEAEQAGRKPPEETRYIFPALDGGEMVARWDMQATPPDIMVTNASMLGAMLSREVEDPMFAMTRNWLLNNEDAYFYLIFDELHLIRGSAGTEVAYLVKSLIERLGLDHPDHMNKLRILASSASLPLDDERGIQSRRYLRDLFAPFGTSIGPGDEGSTEADFWQGCVLAGRPNLPQWNGDRLPGQPFAELYRTANASGNGFVAHVSRTPEVDAAIRAVAQVFCLPNDEMERLVPAIAAKSAEALVGACRAGEGVRATATRQIAEVVFQQPLEDAENAVKGLMLARALPDAGTWDVQAPQGTPLFRIHTFIRNVEGLFGAPVCTETGVTFQDLTIERGTSHGRPEPGRIRGPRLFEMLYCEACGDLLLGGQRGAPSGTTVEVELLPSAFDLEKLPEKATSEYYDTMTFEQFAVFWPRRNAPSISERGYDRWDPASLNPETGVVTIHHDGHVSDNQIGGHLYYQTDDAFTNNRGVAIGRRMAQPFCCPNCGTDYSFRPRSNRSRSPIRAFRTGVTKASQIVATELFELLHAIGAEAKSIVFSDSRQDAANQALEIERLHLRDLRREVLVAVARSYMEEQEGRWVPPEQRRAILTQLALDENFTELQDRGAEFKAMDSDSHVDVPNRKVRLDRLFQFSQGNASSEVSTLVSEYVRLGIHPFDEVGRKRLPTRMPWHTAFTKQGDKICFSSGMTQLQLQELGTEILRTQYELVDDVIFSNTFFALEETGLAYPSLSRNAGPEVDEMDAWLRVFASAYRVEDNKYFDPARARQWASATDVPLTNRVARFATAVFGAQGYSDGLNDIFRRLNNMGHTNGVIRVGTVYLKVTKAGDPYWRCGSCERIHLHIGVNRCTRCRVSLANLPSGRVEELWEGNFLGRRIVRGHEDGVPRFRLKCEELTGQTDDFSDRLRKFKGIFVDQASEIERLASEIDMLSVTTTMEVGIDIGSLQSVYQANMPPQRFNYQQRVGRAGRRGQAFSFVVTFCRGRSHDAYYFLHPDAITGDPPPPPFLAVDHLPIPLRILRKVWLRAAFKLLRDECAAAGEPYPGDFLVPPDIHGEFITTGDYYLPTPQDWPARLRSALERTSDIRDRFVHTATITDEQETQLLGMASVDQLMNEIAQVGRLRPTVPTGLAQFFAECGLLPMYGMPTRVRQLYLGLGVTPNDNRDEYYWSTMDRDLDLAIFEYAPGAILTKDKQKHRVIGFSGSLLEPQVHGNAVDLIAVSPWCGDEAHIALCPQCGSASHSRERPPQPIECEDCHSPIQEDLFNRYLTPTAFRTDFRAESNDLDEVGVMQRRTLATVLRAGTPEEHGNVCIRTGAGITVMHLNDGEEDEYGNPRFFQVEEVIDNEVPVPNKLRRAVLAQSQAISSDHLAKSGQGTRWTLRPNTTSSFGLVSRKETDAIYLEMLGFDQRLALDLVARKGIWSWLPARAAAISATHIMVQKAALILDVAPDEFEALEPRRRNSRPTLQIADALINGSGLCRRLGEARSDGRPEIIHLIEEVVLDSSAWPLKDVLRTDHEGHHFERCQTSCYRCIQQYGNRRYHGLLDWRLGLAYLRALVTPGYSCGLQPSENDYPELDGWLERAHALTEAVAAMRPRIFTTEVIGSYELPSLVEHNALGNPVRRMVVVHPLWRTDADLPMRVLGNFRNFGNVRFVDTFNLERRPLKALEMAWERGFAPSQ